GALAGHLAQPLPALFGQLLEFAGRPIHLPVDGNHLRQPAINNVLVDAADAVGGAFGAVGSDSLVLQPLDRVRALAAQALQLRVHQRPAERPVLRVQLTAGGCCTVLEVVMVVRLLLLLLLVLVLILAAPRLDALLLELLEQLEEVDPLALIVHVEPAALDRQIIADAYAARPEVLLRWMVLLLLLLIATTGVISARDKDGGQLQMAVEQLQRALDRVEKVKLPTFVHQQVKRDDTAALFQDLLRLPLDRQSVVVQ
uniref:Uncharacterized protein n=1 Tax=Anopheles melas TaxID=34690 RepID=A0A182UDY0_9DIPT